MTGPPALVAASGVLGLAVGSFLNVVNHRVVRRQSIVRPRSSCPTCATLIRDRDNIPVVSWLVLQGRCRSCGAPIPARYPLVEAGTAAIFAVSPGGWACHGCCRATWWPSRRCSRSRSSTSSTGWSSAGSFTRPLLAIGILLSGVAARDRRGTALGATAVSGAAALAAVTLVALQASWRPRPHAALPLTPLVAAATLLTCS